MTLISVFASGSRGDVQPYVALGRGLQQAGHDVRFLATEDFEALATGAGLTFASIGPSLQARVESDEWRQTIEGGNFLVILRQMQSEMAAAAGPLVDRMLELLPGSDLIIAGLSGMGFQAAADEMGIPVIPAYLVPLTPTSKFPSPLASMLPDIGPLNRASFHLTRQMLWRSSNATDGLIRARLGLPRGSLFGPFGAEDRATTPVLYGYSPHVLPRPADWSTRYQVTGYWFLDEPDGWSPPADLLAFLDAGSPPVYIGFGSMGSRDPEETAQLALDALARSGQRGILAAGWGGLRLTDVPDSVYLAGSLPHSWLLPRMAAVVHHGGVGTTAAAFRSGVPSAVVPFMADQPYWGKRTAELGVGPEPIPRKQLTARKLAAAITQMVDDQSMRQKAADLGGKIQAEDGVGAAVAIIQSAAPL